MTVARNSFYAVSGVVVPLAVTVITLPIYISVIGAERYGAIALCWIIFNYLGGADFGIAQSATRRIAALGPRRPASQARVMGTAFGISAIMAVVLGLAAYAASRWYFSGPLEMSGGIRGELREATWLIALTTGIMAFTSVMHGCAVGRQDFKFTSLSTMLSNAGSQLVPLLFAYTMSPAMPTLVAGVLVSRLAGSMPVVFRLWRTVIGRFGLHFRRREARNLLSYGKWIMVFSFTEPMLLGFDRFLIGARLGAVAVVAYAVPFQVANRLQLLPRAVLMVIFPHLASLETEESRREAQQYLLVFASIFAPVIVGIICLTQPLLELWLGEHLDPRSVIIGRIVLAAYWMTGLSGVVTFFILGRGDARFVALLRLAEVPCYLVVLFIGSSLYGLTGVAIAWGIFQVIDFSFMLWRAGIHSAALLRRIALSAAILLTAVLLHPWLYGWIPSLAAACVLCGLAVLNAYFSFPVAFWRDIITRLARIRKPA